MTEQDIDKEFMDLQDAIFSCVANQPCRDPMDAVMALSCVMCDILVQIGMDKEPLIFGAIRENLNAARARYRDVHSTEVH